MKPFLFPSLALTILIAADASAQTPEQPAKGPKRIPQADTGAGKRPEPTIAAGSYASDPDCLFDFWKAESDKPTPLLVFIHGGGFKAGSRNAVSPAFLAAAKAQGYSVISIDYPFLVKKPVQDILPLAARSVQYARHKAKEWNIDPQRIAVLGGSAGAGTSLWIAAHPDLADASSEDPVARESSRVQAAASINGQATYDLLKWEQLVGPPPEGILKDGNEPRAFYHLAEGESLDSEAAKAARAKVDIHGLLDKSTPPLLLFTAQRDGAKKANDRGGYVHSPRHSEALAAKAKELGIPHELVVGENAAGKEGSLEALAFFKKRFDEIKTTTADGEKKKGAKASELLTPSTTPLYKTVDDVKLKLHVFNPKDHKQEDHRPAVVFFFGGGFRSGAPAQFYPHSDYLASRGVVAISAEYRIKNLHNTGPEKSVADAKSALRWVRAHAAELGIDPSRIAAGGGSAGGFLAAATATLSGYDEPGEDVSVSARPDALLIYNGLFDLGSGDYGSKQDISPLKNVRAPFPPTAFFVGSQDKLLPLSSVGAIKEAVEGTGGRFDLHIYQGQGHGFFNYAREGGEYYGTTLRETDRFLTSLGWLAGEPSAPN